MRAELWVVRHGAAADSTAELPRDDDRPLTAKGESQARRLSQILPELDRLLSSPLLRARQTAEPLAALAPSGVEILSALAHAEAAELPEALVQALQAGALPGERVPRVAIVGHEPQLSETIGLLIAPQAPAPAAVRMRKGAVARLAGGLRPGGMRLELLLAQADLKRAP